MAGLSVVVPLLDDGPALARLLPWLKEQLKEQLKEPLEKRPDGQFPGAIEIIVADGGSADDGPALASACGCVVINAPRGRGSQLAAGIAASRGDWIWMLHADASPSAAAIAHVLALADAPRSTAPAWGRFDVAFDDGPALALVAFMMNRRSCLTGICTGDQGIFVHRGLLERAGGMPVQPLMEDVELSRRLRRQARPCCRHERVGASARRWRRHGLMRTVLSMWWWRYRYWRGADPRDLAAEYYGR